MSIVGVKARGVAVWVRAKRVRLTSQLNKQMSQSVSTPTLLPRAGSDSVSRAPNV